MDQFLYMTPLDIADRNISIDIKNESIHILFNGKKYFSKKFETAIRKYCNVPKNEATFSVKVTSDTFFKISRDLDSLNENIFHTTCQESQETCYNLIVDLYQQGYNFFYVQK